MASAASDEYSADGTVTVPEAVPSTVNVIALFELVTPGVVLLLAKPEIAPETYAVIANVYDPATGAFEEPPLTDNKLEDEAIKLEKIAPIINKINNPMTPKFNTLSVTG